MSKKDEKGEQRQPTPEEIAGAGKMRGVAGTPRCPRCGEQPARLNHVPVMLQARAAITALVFYCANPKCGVIFNVQVVDVEQPRVQPVGDGKIILAS